LREETIDTAASNTDAIKAAGTEKQTVSELAASGKTEIPEQDAVQVAAVAATAGVVKDAAVPIEAQQQAGNTKASAEVEKKEITPEKEAIPAAETGAQKEADKVAVVKPDAGKDAKQPEPQEEKKNQQTKESSAKSAPKVSQKQGKTAASKYHVIAKGDTLMSLSRKYNTDLDKLRKLNGLDDKSTLKVGTKIRVN
jgi:LysM repeat protein